MEKIGNYKYLKYKIAINMKLKIGWISLFVSLFIVISGYLVFASIKSDLLDIKDVVGNYQDNKGFSQNVQQIQNSVVLILVKTNQIPLGGVQTGAIFVDEQGQAWKKGTGFSFKEGYIITANHLIENINPNDILIVWNGVPYTDTISNYGTNTDFDFAILKTNLSIPPLLINEENKPIPSGAKVAFIGFPLQEKYPILNSGIISSTRLTDDSKPQYIVNAFVNKGNSGGPLFLSDSGEVIGIITSRANEDPMLPLPQIDEDKLTEGEKVILSYNIAMYGLLMQNVQIGMGIALPINKQVIENLANKIS